MLDQVGGLGQIQNLGSGLSLDKHFNEIYPKPKIT
jgi:hypothetical protein